MEVTLKEAAASTGLTERQLRYAIRQGRMKGSKKAGRWFVELEESPRTEKQRAVQDTKKARHDGRIEAALALRGPPEDKVHYSVRKMRAFQAGAPIWRDVRNQFGEDYPASELLEQCLEHVTVGCHRFSRGEKTAAYSAARDAASRAVCALSLDDDAAAEGFAERIEQDLMPALAGLLRRSEGRRR